MEEKDIEKVLRRLGAKASSRGYSYIAYGMSLVSGDDRCLEYITKSLYVDTAHHFNTSVACVERDIRSVVEGIWKTGERDFLSEVCGGEPAERRPSNKEFFEMLRSYFARASADGGTGCPDGCCASCHYVKELQEKMERLIEENRQLRVLLGKEEEYSN